MPKVKVACVQLNAGNEVETNLASAVAHVRKAAAQGAQLIALPEYCVLLDGSGRVMREHSPEEAKHSVLPALQALARQTGAWLLVGSLTVRLADGRMANRSYLISSTGELAGHYDKIHMFDVTLPI